MNDEQIDKIMKTYMKDNNGISVEKSVMERVRAYENKKASRLFYLECALSFVLFCAGIISIFLLQYLFDLLSPFFELYSLDFAPALLISAGILIIIVLSAALFVYLSVKSAKDNNKEKAIPLNV